ncbi:MAG: hypothetical protein H7A46_08725 [Verrucomicrobiales bacterium]|nr:hypothetical protein [Verrucomicrobiales bacterium]
MIAWANKIAFSLFLSAEVAGGWPAAHAGPPVGTDGEYASGRLLFRNRYTGIQPPVDAPFYDDQLHPLEGEDYLAQLYVWRTGQGFQAVGEPVSFRKPVPEAPPGYFWGDEVEIPLWGPEVAWMQVRAWHTASGGSFESAALSAGWTGNANILYLPDIFLTAFQAMGDAAFRFNPHDRIGLTGPPQLPAKLVGLEYPGRSVIVKSPSSRVVVAGQQATLSVVASRCMGVSYQWYRKVGDQPDGFIEGATNATYTTAPLQADASFWVEVSNVAGTVASEPARVEVLQEPPRLKVEAGAGGPLLTLDGEIGRRYRVEGSSQLQPDSWVVLFDVILTHARYRCLDTAPAGQRPRFYRAVALP